MKKTSIISPSEKNITSENFPVASWIIPKSLRNDIVTLYNFARTADN
ncbi:MAG: squalene/phytoene synthase family protein, partial [Rhodospirillales bacterium]|nr:squalene/phytoene synthase family protein [Rhodospirillales bacterium]